MTKALRAREAFKLALSIVLFYWLALAMDWDLAKYGALAIVLVSLGTAGASAQKGVLRVIGTTVGLAAGLFGLAIFSQDRWGNMVFQSAWLVVIGYFMLGSRYSYAWFVAGFLPSLVWASTYGKVDDAFHYATFRYLETTAGIVIYTIVTAVLWPRRAGDQLDAPGAELWAGLHELFGLSRRQLTEGQLPDGTRDLRTKLVGIAARMATTLQAAYADTPAVAAQKQVWEILRLNVRALGDAMELWVQSIGDCRRLELATLLPGLESELDSLEKRFARIGVLWQARREEDAASATADDDHALLERSSPEIDAAASAGLNHFDQAALHSFAQQLELLDVTSRELLRTMRVLAGLDPARGYRPQSLPPDLYRPSRWAPQHLVKALFPALCFIVGYLFWIVADPPTGPSVPNFAATVSLSLILNWSNPLTLLITMLATIVFIVAPIYFFVMPPLDTGIQLLSLIGIYTFIFAYLGGRWPVLKLMPLLLFVMMTGISNQQSYSFPALLDGGIMIALGLAIIVVVHMLLSPVRPEKIFLHGLRRFFRGCARMTDGFTLHRPGDLRRGRRLRKHIYRSSIMPVPRELQAIAKQLDHSDNSPDAVQQLLSALQSIAFRFQALEVAHARVARSSPEDADPLAVLGRRLRECVRKAFATWSRLDDEGTEQESEAMQELSRDVERRLDASAEDESGLDEQTRTALYAGLGCARGLIDSMAETRTAMKRITWDEWQQARF